MFVDMIIMGTRVLWLMGLRMCDRKVQYELLMMV